MSEADVVAFCRGLLAPYKVPRHVRFAQELPMSPQGKVLKRVLEQEYGSTAAASDGS